jgi:hypothetical protein
VKALLNPDSILKDTRPPTVVLYACAKKDVIDQMMCTCQLLHRTIVEETGDARSAHCQSLVLVAYFCLPAAFQSCEGTNINGINHWLGDLVLFEAKYGTRRCSTWLRRNY